MAVLKMFSVDLLGLYGLVPVVVLEDDSNAVALADALIKAELPVMEITLRTPAGIDCIKRIHDERPSVVLGAGTVLSVEQCKQAIAAGASYIVCPGFNAAVVDYCLENDVCIIPGCVTPSEIDLALARNIKTVKYFPALVYGGVNGCKALYGPYASAGIKFIPTGGIGPDNLDDYMDKPFVCAVGGGWLAPTSMIASGDWDGITAIVKKAVRQMLGFSLRHVGINLKDEETAFSVAGKLEKLFGWASKNGNSSLFNDTYVEVMKTKGRGDMGHIAITTNNVDRALFYLKKRGMFAEEGTVKRNAAGVATFAYLEGQIGGFAFHLNLK